MYKAYEDDEADAGYREAEAYAGLIQGNGITDIKSAAGTASSCMPLTHEHMQHCCSSMVTSELCSPV